MSGRQSDAGASLRNWKSCRTWFPAPVPSGGKIVMIEDSHESLAGESVTPCS